MSLARTVKGRAAGQAVANVETQTGKVTKTYKDGIGNIIAADVLLGGQARTLSKVTNASGLKLYRGMSAQVNWPKGTRFAPVITGAGGGEASAAISSAASATSTAATDQTGTTPPDLTDLPLLLASEDDSLLAGVVEVPGANVYFTDSPSEETSGGFQNAQRVISAVPLVLTALPAVGTLPDGTLVDLVDGSNNPLGLYRLDKTAAVWRRRDAGTSGATFVLLTPAASASITLTAGPKEIIVVAAANVTITLPSAALHLSTIQIRAIGAGVTVQAASGQTIEGASSIALTNQISPGQPILLEGYGGLNAASNRRRCITLAPDGTTTYYLASDTYAG